MRQRLICIVLILVAANLKAQQPLEATSRLYDLNFTVQELDTAQPYVQKHMESIDRIRKHALDNAVPPALYFNPLPYGFTPDKNQIEIKWPLPENISRPPTDEGLNFLSVLELAGLIKTQQITSLELTQHFLKRLKAHGPTLQCVVSVTEELALQQARRADQELAAGLYRGPLHGIPYGAKDLFAVPGFPTSWGATPFKDQVRSDTATIVQKLEEAGAILVAKLTLGALAMGDVWYGGTTKNPWNLELGSSGSSAGSASATVAGLVPFAIGTETRGSIVSPSTRCGATGLRPTYGSVSRAGGMALSWSMDKVGPICRNATDCALIFAAIVGSDGKDYTVIDAAFNYDATLDPHTLKVAYFEDLFAASNYNSKNDSISLAKLRGLGVELIPISWDISVPVDALGFILLAEAAASFDELTRSNQDDLLVRQDRWAWPNTFRHARFIPAVEYIQANRIRWELIQQLHQLLKSYDVIITPTYGGDQLLATNLTGQPVISVPNGFSEDGTPTSITFLGNLFDEEKIIRFAEFFQAATDHEDVHPEAFK